MRKLLLAFALILSLSLPVLADDVVLSTADKIKHVVKVQGTVIGEKIVSAAILDDIIVREGDVVLIDVASGRLVAKLGPKEIENYPEERLLAVVSIVTGHVAVKYLGESITLIARP